jgi:hypothetical protein
VALVNPVHLAILEVPYFPYYLVFLEDRYAQLLLEDRYTQYFPVNLEVLYYLYYLMYLLVQLVLCTQSVQMAR